MVAHRAQRWASILLEVRPLKCSLAGVRQFHVARIDDGDVLLVVADLRFDVVCHVALDVDDEGVLVEAVVARQVLRLDHDTSTTTVPQMRPGLVTPNSKMDSSPSTTRILLGSAAEGTRSDSIDD